MTGASDGSGFRNPALTVDAVVVAGLEAGAPRVLLIRRDREPFAGRWALPGGFVDYGEDPDLAVGRELLEETGLGGVALAQLRVFGRPGRDPRGHTVSVVYTGTIDGPPPAVQGGDDAREARWFAPGDLPPLAFDHGDAVTAALASLGLDG